MPAVRNQSDAYSAGDDNECKGTWYGNYSRTNLDKLTVHEYDRKIVDLAYIVLKAD